MATNALEHSNFSLRNINKNCTHVITSSSDDHRKIRDLLKTEKQKFFYYTPKDEKPINLLIRGLDNTYEESDIESALLDLSINTELIKVVRFSTSNSRKNDVKLNLWLVKVKPTSDVTGLMRLRFLLNQSIAVEKPRTKEIIQCRRCQRFGHVAFNCVLDYRCVKCNENHEPGQCSNKIESNTITNENGEYETLITSKVFCVNCQSFGHSASYSPNSIK